MRLKSLQNYIETLKRYINKETVSFVLSAEGYQYKFKVNSRVSLTVIKDKEELLLDVADRFQDLSIPLKDIEYETKKFFITYCTRTGEVYKKSEYYICNEQTMYIELFKLMKHGVKLIIEYNGEDIICYYVSGKLIYFKEKEEEYIMYCNNLYKMYSLMPDYRVSKIEKDIVLDSYNDFVRRGTGTARSLNKRFIKMENCIN